MASAADSHRVRHCPTQVAGFRLQLVSFLSGGGRKEGKKEGRKEGRSIGAALGRTDGRTDDVDRASSLCAPRAGAAVADADGRVGPGWLAGTANRRFCQS